MEGTVAQTPPLNERPHNKARFVYRGLTVPFMLLAFCFAAWGSAANLTDVMVGVFRHIFVISNARSALIQTAYYGGYFSLAIPTAFINKRFRLQDPRAHRAGSGRSRRRAFLPGE
jgi:MFS transporter, FHS family, L-fucose permease